MTVIVGLNSGYSTWFGADSSASDDTSLEIRKEPKIWKDGHWIMGVTPSFRMAQILQFSLSLDDSLPSPANCSTGYLIEELVPLLTSLLSREPCSSEEGWRILLGGQGFLWDVQDDYSISEVTYSTAIGSGSDYSLGALYNMRNHISSYHPITPRLQVLYACNAAANYSLSVAGPIKLLSSERTHQWPTSQLK